MKTSIILENTYIMNRMLLEYMNEKAMSDEVLEMWNTVIGCWTKRWPLLQSGRKLV